MAYWIFHGGREPRINWADIDQTSLHFDEEYSSNYEAPVDEHWDFSLYVSEKGNPDTNNLGHKQATIQGRKVVIVPGRQIWKVRGAHAQRV